MDETREDLTDQFIVACLLDDLDTVENAPAWTDEDAKINRKTAKALRRVLKFYGCFKEDVARTPGCDDLF